MEHCHLSDVGQVRQNNEDVAWSGKNKNNNVAGIICDGLGGYKGGSTASGIVVDTFKQKFEDINLSDYSKEQIDAWIDQVIYSAREKISNKIKENEALKNMATTFVCCIIVNNKAYIYNVGDSRCWLISSSKSFQITEDQNLMNYLIKVKAPKEHFQIHKNNLYAITQYIGVLNTKKIFPDRHVLDLKDNDYIILTSDGCHNFIDIKDMIKYILSDKNLNNVCHSIIAKALTNDSNDNLSIVTIRI